MELTAIDGIGRVGSNSTCRYTANTTSIINHNFAKFCILRGNLTVIAVRISYVQFSITKSTVFIEYAIIQLYISNVATSCFDTSIFVYNKFTTSCIESPIRIYKEWHFAIGCGCTHGQIIFRIQSVSLNTINIDSYTTNFAALINGNPIVDCYSAFLVKFYRGLVIRNSISSDIHICQFSSLICIDFIFCRNKASRFNSAIGSANAYILASDITKKKILIQAYFISLLPVLICFFYGNIATIDYFCMFPSFLLYSMELTAIDGIGRVGSNSTCRYTANTTSIINHNFAKFCILRGNLAVVAVCIAYIQLAVTQCGIFIEYAIFQNYVADFAFGCGYFAVFIYNQFAVGSIECAVAVYEERHGPIYICSAYGQIVFGIQCIGLNGVCICITIFIYREFAVCCIKCAVAVYEERRSTICFCSTYCYAACCYTAACPDSAFAAADAYKSVRIISCKSNIIIQSNLIFLATVFIEAFGYSNISITIGNSTVFECFCFYTFQLTYIHCICIIDTSFDIYDTASDTSFTRLPYRFTDRNNAIIAITRQDVSLFYLAGIAKSGRIFRTRNIRIVTNG